MNNNDKFRFSNIDKFRELSLNGEDIKIAVLELKRNKEHAQWVIEMIKMIVPNAQVDLFLWENLIQAEKIYAEIEIGKYDILNVSLIGIAFRQSPRFNVIALNTFIVAAAGNSGEEEYVYPASDDKCLSVGATFNGEVKSSFSTFNDKLDILNFNGVELPSGKTFNGTSCSAPYTVGMIALFFQLYKRRHGRNPMIGEVTEYVHENCLDVYEEGFDKLSGYGVFRLSFDFEKKIWDWKTQQYLTISEWLDSIKKEG